MKLKQIFSRDMIILVLGQVFLCLATPLSALLCRCICCGRTNSPSLFGVVTACSFLPMVVFSFLGGGLRTG